MHIATTALKAKGDNAPWTGIVALALAFVLGVLCPYMCYRDACSASLGQEHGSCVANEVAHEGSRDHENRKGPSSHDHDVLCQGHSVTKRTSREKAVTLPARTLSTWLHASPHIDRPAPVGFVSTHTSQIETVRLLI